jgi:hypothetical protein
MTFAMVVSVGMLPVLTVLRRRRRKTPGVSCRIRQRLVLVLLVEVHHRRSRRPSSGPVVHVPSVSSLYQFQHPFSTLIPITPSPPRVSVPIHQRAISGRGRTTISPMGRDSLANPRGTRVRQVFAFFLSSLPREIEDVF